MKLMFEEVESEQKTKNEKSDKESYQDEEFCHKQCKCEDNVNDSWDDHWHHITTWCFWPGLNQEAQKNNKSEKQKVSK